MNTLNNSNTLHFCRDCENTSLSACKNGHGDYLLPCHILRKLARKARVAHEILYKDINSLIPDYYIRVRDSFDYIKYIRNLSFSEDFIILTIVRLISDWHGDEATIDFVNEYAGDLELNSFEKATCEKLARQIQNFAIRTRM
jgi:hypothetical protein